MLKYLFIISFALSILTSCGDPDSESLMCTEVDYDTAFSIQADNSYCFPDGVVLSVTALNNEFCPCDAICFWEGQMTIDMQWDFPGEELLDYRYQAAPTAQAQNEPLPDGTEISTDQDDIIFEEECSDSNPSPEIIETIIVVRK